MVATCYHHENSRLSNFSCQKIICGKDISNCSGTRITIATNYYSNLQHLITISFYYFLAKWILVPLLFVMLGSIGSTLPMLS